jgi:hypothetical protein
MPPISGAAVYGNIIVGAVLAAESAKHETYAKTVGAVAIIIVAYWLAHAYSEFADDRLEHKQRVTLDGLERALASTLPIVVGAAIPVLALLICWVAGARLTTAVTAAIWTSAAMIVVVEIVAGVRAEISGRALVAQAAAGAALGLLVIALKVVLR